MSERYPQVRYYGVDGDERFPITRTSLSICFIHATPSL